MPSPPSAAPTNAPSAVFIVWRSEGSRVCQSFASVSRISTGPGRT